MKLAKTLAAAATAAAILVPAAVAQAAPAGQPSYPTISVHLWRHAVTEPGDLGVTVKATSCITVAEADAVRDGGNYIVYSDPQTEHGTTIVLHFKFTRSPSPTSPTGAKPGPWTVRYVWFYQCGGNPEGVPFGWSPLDDAFYVHAGHR